MKTTITALLLAALVLPLSAQEEKKKAPKGSPDKAFAKLDADSDGFVSKDEFAKGPLGKKDAAKAETVFKKKDFDSNGKLSKQEFVPAPKGGKKKKKKGGE